MYGRLNTHARLENEKPGSVLSRENSQKMKEEERENPGDELFEAQEGCSDVRTDWKDKLHCYIRLGCGNK